MEEQNKTDEELVALSLQNPDYYGLIIKRYEKPLLRYIQRLLFYRTDEAEDILQEVFIKAYRNLAGFEKDLKFSSWIYRITHNECVNFFRKSSARPQTVSMEQQDGTAIDLPFDESFEEDFDQALTQTQVRSIILKMDPKYREALMLRFIEDKDYQEISDILRKPMGSVATLLSRAKTQFKNIYEQEKLVLNHGSNQR